MTVASRVTLGFLFGLVVAGPVGFLLGRHGGDFLIASLKAPPSVKEAQIPDGPYKILTEWSDLSAWTAKNMRAVSMGANAPGGAKAVSLIEDDQKIWRNIQTALPTAVPGRAMKVTAEVKLENGKRQAVLMVLAGLNRFACNLRWGGNTDVMTIGDAAAGKCSAVKLADGWWNVALTGVLPVTRSKDLALVALALTAEGFGEEYQGDGKSGLAVGKVTVAQLRE